MDLRAFYQKIRESRKRHTATAVPVVVSLTTPDGGRQVRPPK